MEACNRLSSFGALSLLERPERERDDAFQHLKAKLERGAAEAERGESRDGIAAFGVEDLAVFAETNTFFWCDIIVGTTRPNAAKATMIGQSIAHYRITAKLGGREF